jgi:hypothetical protein
MRLASLQIEIREPSLIRSSPSPDPSTATANTCPSTLATLDFVASDETLDRYGDVICASGWHLDTYRRNPVFQNAHQYGDILFTLGRALVTEIRGADDSGSGASNSGLRPHLFQRVQFATDVNPIARIAYGLYKGKFLNAVSVGFLPVRWEDATGARSIAGGSPPEDQQGQGAEALSVARSTRPRRRYLEQELLEVSAVGIPANPNALALGVRSGAVSKSDLSEALDLLRSLSVSIDSSGERPGASDPGRSHFDRANLLLTFARELHGVLRRA